MDKIEERLQDISEIRNLMERNTKFLSLSGLSGISSGICGLIGMAVAWNYLDYRPGEEFPAYFPDGIDFTRFFLLVAGLVFCSAVGSALFFSLRMARRRQLPMWNPTARRLLIDLSIPLAVGGIFALIQISHGIFLYLAATTLIFYGLALFSAHRNTITEIRWLALCEMGLGLASAFFPGYGLLMWGIGFGLLHIGYGTVMYFKYER